MSIRAQQAGLSIRDIFSLIRPELNQVETNLVELTRGTLAVIDHINQYLHNSGGKRLRPAVLLLCSKLCGFRGDPAVKLASVVELIHVATLVHDDIIDNANLRRGRLSVNAKWGNESAVLVGDWMYMTSFNIALQLRHFKILDVLIDITRTMINGELMQLDQDGHIDVSEKDQMEVCLRKTARLFSGCGRLAAMLADAEAGQEEALADYGRSLGLAFQLTDDLLDFTSDESVLGKPVLKDLQEGKLTLPIIYLLRRANEDEKEFVRNMVLTHDFSADNKMRVIELVNRYGTLRDIQKLARVYADRSREALKHFPPSVYRKALLQIPDFVLDRQV